MDSNSSRSDWKLSAQLEITKQNAKPKENTCILFFFAIIKRMKFKRNYLKLFPLHFPTFCNNRERQSALVAKTNPVDMKSLRSTKSP